MKKNRFSFFVIYINLLLSGCSWYALPGSEDSFRVTQADVDILLAAKDLLSNETKWIKHSEQQCDMSSTQWTLFCALQKASVDVTGDFKLRRAALEETRIAAEEIAGKQLGRRLLDFNNMSSTTFEDIQKALDLALKRVRLKLDAP